MTYLINIRLWHVQQITCMYVVVIVSLVKNKSYLCCIYLFIYLLLSLLALRMVFLTARYILKNTAIRFICFYIQQVNICRTIYTIIYQFVDCLQRNIHQNAEVLELKDCKICEQKENYSIFFSQVFSKPREWGQSA